MMYDLPIMKLFEVHVHVDCGAVMLQRKISGIDSGALDTHRPRG